MTSSENAKWKKFSKNLRKSDHIAKNAMYEAGAYTIEHIQRRTPFITGKLQYGWTGGQRIPAIEYVRTLPIRKSGSTLYLTFTNETEYASWVEYGHHQEVGRYVAQISARLIREWVPGFYYAHQGIDDAEVNIGRWIGVTVQLDLNKL